MPRGASEEDGWPAVPEAGEAAVLLTLPLRETTVTPEGVPMPGATAAVAAALLVDGTGGGGQGGGGG